MSESRSSEGQAVKQETKEPSTAKDVFDKVKQLREEARMKLFGAGVHASVATFFGFIGVVSGDVALDQWSRQQPKIVDNVDVSILASGMGFFVAALNGALSAIDLSESQDRRTRANTLEENLLNRLAKIPWKEVQG